MPNTLPVPRKRRTREHIIADLSVNHLERFILEAGHTAERQRADYGYDVSIDLFDEFGYVEPGHADFQLKATDSIVQDPSGAFLIYRLRIEDYNLWVNEPLPVFFVLYNAMEKRAFWLHVQRYFAEEAQFPNVSENRGEPQMNKPITFGQLERALFALGYKLEEIPGSHRLYTCSNPNAMIMLPVARRNQPIRPFHQMSVRSTLDNNGILPRKEFESFVERANKKKLAS